MSEKQKQKINKRNDIVDFVGCNLNLFCLFLVLFRIDYVRSLISCLRPWIPMLYSRAVSELLNKLFDY